jgi:hypothetical protein
MGEVKMDISFWQIFLPAFAACIAGFAVVAVADRLYERWTDKGR